MVVRRGNGRSCPRLLTRITDFWNPLNDICTSKMAKASEIIVRASVFVVVVVLKRVGDLVGWTG